MSSLMKKILFMLIGILAGFASWGLVETVSVMQGMFPSFLVLSITLGVIVGLVNGFFFGASEGIFLADNVKIARGIVTGAVVGIAGGIIGFLIGQNVLFLIGDRLQGTSSFKYVGLPLSRALAWAILGIFIGITEGVRSLSLKKISVGIIGGFLGGALGGLVLEYLPLLSKNLLVSRMIGFVIFGLSIGFFYGLVEKSLAQGLIRLLNGKYKGKEYLINQRKIKIGKSESNDITLDEYENVSDLHAEIKTRGKDVIISSVSASSPVTVNDDRIKEHILKLGDVIKIGRAKFIFRYR